jgi:hypothetical protein
LNKPTVKLLQTFEEKKPAFLPTQIQLGRTVLDT